MYLALIAVAAFSATFLGGLFAIRLKDRLHLILGFSGGAVIAAALFDLLPEAFELVGERGSPKFVTTLVAVGFLTYLVLDRVLGFHDHSGKCCPSQTGRGALGAGSLSVHSFFDGLALGLAFQVSAKVGLIVAAAVLTHDFSDGINTVNLVLKNGGTRKQALRWLLVDAVAPLLGVVSTLLFSLPETLLGITLAVFSGSFLYIGASDLVPESYHNHPKKVTTLMTIAGMALMYLVISIAG